MNVFGRHAWKPVKEKHRNLCAVLKSKLSENKHRFLKTNSIQLLKQSFTHCVQPILGNFSTYTTK